MRKYVYILIVLAAISLTGCKKEEKMPDYIPVNLTEDNDDSTGSNDKAPVEDDKLSTGEEGTEADEQGEGSAKDEETPDKPVEVGKTSTMYVKLNQYGGYLNVRPTPSTEGTPVGFLVHAEAVDVITIKDGWASILYNGNICYVNADYLVEKRPPYLNPPTITPKPTQAPEQAPADGASASPEEDAEPREI